MRLGATALTLAVALAVVGVVSAEEDSSSSWFSRLFAGSPAKTAEPDKSDAKKTEATTTSPRSAAKRFKQAQADWDRRVRVCLALKNLADKLDDDDLRRKANLLDQRAWDAFVAATGAKQSPTRPVLDADAKGTTSLDRNTKETPQ